MSDKTAGTSVECEPMSTARVRLALRRGTYDTHTHQVPFSHGRRDIVRLFKLCGNCGFVGGKADVHGRAKDARHSNTGELSARDRPTQMISVNACVLLRLYAPQAKCAIVLPHSRKLRLHDCASMCICSVRPALQHKNFREYRAKGARAKHMRLHSCRAAELVTR